MRLKVWDRVFSAVSGLLILVIGIGLFVFGAGIFPFKLDVSFLDRAYSLWQRVAMVAVAVALCLLGLRGFAMLFRSSRERGFIMQHTEYGDLSISLSAMENMVKKCVDTHDELKVTSTRIHHAREGVIIAMRISLANGVNIPITVSALQKQIKQYITSCSGVDVKEVRVMVETNNSLGPACIRPEGGMLADVDAASKAGAVVSSLHEAAQNAMPQDTPAPAPVEKLPLHQRLFRREEKPHTVPTPPEAEPESSAPTAQEAVLPPTAEETVPVAVAEETNPVVNSEEEV